MICSKVWKNNIAPLLRAFFILVLLRAGNAACALDPVKDLKQCALDNWTTRDGLPPRDIEAMTQTPDGYLWLATRAGLVRFDGVTFKLYNCQNTPGFTRDMVRSLAVARSGGLWVGTDGGGFGRFYGERFIRYRTGHGAEEWYETLAIHEGQDGTMWAGGRGTPHLICLRSGALETVPTSFEDFRGIVETPDHSLWFAVRGTGLVQRRLDGRFQTYAQKQGLSDVLLTCLARSSDGCLWMGTEDAGIFRFQNGKFTHLTTRQGLSSNQIHALYFDRQGNLWIGTQDGLNRLTAGKISVFRKADGLYDSIVGAITEDREGNLWVGSGCGLNRFRNTKLTPFELRASHGAAAIHAAAQTTDGTLWFATDQGLFCKRGDRLTRCTARLGLSSDNVQALCSGARNVLWLSDDKGNLLRGQQGRFAIALRDVSAELVGEDAFGPVVVHWVKDAREICRVEGGKLIPLPVRGGIGYCFTCHLDSGGTLWIGSTEGVIQVGRRSATLYKQGLPVNAHVLSIADSPDGTLWLGTDKGLARFRRGQFTMYSLPQGLPDDNLYQMQTDAHNRLWIGGNRGIFSLHIEDLARCDVGRLPAIPTVMYGAQDGIRRFPLGGTAIKTRNGELWFPGDLGLTIVNPAQMAANPLPPPTIIEQAQGNGKLLTRDASITIPPGKGELEIHYTGLSLVSPELVRFRYKLEGYDKNWVDAGSRRSAYYTNLPPGTYRFHVLACNNDGVWNQTGDTLVFTFEPHYYETLWFRVLCALALLAIIRAGYRLRVKQLNLRNQALEARVQERTLALREANNQLKTLATTDGMTRLANHRAFQEQIRMETARVERSHSPCALLLLDVDHFKEYNDTFGHPAGDEVLRRVASLLRETVREADFPARYGGEEFAVILPETNGETAKHIAERIRSVIAGTRFPTRAVTVSIGVSLYAPGAGSVEALIHQADEALYAAKRGGRNCVRFAEGQIEDGAVEEIASIRPPQLVLVEPQAETSPILCVFDGGIEGMLQEPAGQVLSAMLAVLDLRNWEKEGHSARVARFALRLAQEAMRLELIALDPHHLRELVFGALLHDIGKVCVPEAVLHKPGPLSRREWRAIQRHPLRGAELLEPFEQFHCALPVVRHHHERWDGSGYPDGMAGENIPLTARLVAIADALDTMSTDRPHHAAMPHAEIRKEIEQMAGRQFDPMLVRAFLNVSEAEWERLRANSMAQADWQQSATDISQQKAA